MAVTLLVLSRRVLFGRVWPTRLGRGRVGRRLCRLLRDRTGAGVLAADRGDLPARRARPGDEPRHGRQLGFNLIVSATFLNLVGGRQCRRIPGLCGAEPGGARIHRPDGTGDKGAQPGADRGGARLNTYAVPRPKESMLMRRAVALALLITPVAWRCPPRPRPPIVAPPMVIVPSSSYSPLEWQRRHTSHPVSSTCWAILAASAPTSRAGASTCGSMPQRNSPAMSPEECSRGRPRPTRSAFSADIDWQRLAGVTGLSTHLIFVNRSGANDSHLFGDNVSRSRRFSVPAATWRCISSRLMPRRCCSMAGWTSRAVDERRERLRQFAAVLQLHEQRVCAATRKRCRAAISVIAPSPTRCGRAGSACALRRIPTSRPASMR